MPLPTNDPVAFRGVPAHANKKMAITMTFTQKQVEAMFQRHDALRAQGSSHFPLEIDFDDNKMYIGDIVTPFNRVKEVGTREICQRSPTVSKPLAGITLVGNVIGKLNIQRDYDKDIADNIRKLTEAEVSKRKERHIVRLDSPLVIPKGKKSKPGSGTSSLAKKAITNRVASTQATASIPTSSAGPPATASTSSRSSSLSVRPTPPKSSPKHSTPGHSAASSTSTSAAGSPSLDLTSLRSHMIHYLAFEPRTTRDILFKLGGQAPSAESVREIEETLTTVAEEVRRPKNSQPGPVMWQLSPLVWKEIRPYEYGPLSDADRTKLARKGRLAISSFADSDDPLWDHFKAGVDPSAVPSSTKSKNTEKLSASGHLVKTSEFKGGMFLKEKASTVKGGGGPKKGTTTAKSKAKKEQEDGAEVKARKAVTVLDDPKGKKKASAKYPGITSGTLPSRQKVTEDEEAISSNIKSRQSLSSKAESTRQVTKARQVSDDKGASKRKLDSYEEDGSEMEEGELPVKPIKKRKVSANDSKAKPTTSMKNGSLNIKVEEPLLTNDGSPPPKSVKEGTIASRASASGSSPKATSSGNRASRSGKERERDILDAERQERERRRSSSKRTRRATPSFSSDEDEELDAKHIPSHVTKPRPTHLAPSTSRSASKPARAPSPALPTDKESLRRRYHTYYARYIGITSQFHQQRAKIEDALEADGDSVSADDVDMMDTEQLVQLSGEHDRLRNELERIQRAHAMAF